MLDLSHLIPKNRGVEIRAEHLETPWRYSACRKSGHIGEHFFQSFVLLPVLRVLRHGLVSKLGRPDLIISPKLQVYESVRACRLRQSHKPNPTKHNSEPGCHTKSCRADRASHTENGSSGKGLVSILPQHGDRSGLLVIEMALEIVRFHEFSHS